MKPTEEQIRIWLTNPPAFNETKLDILIDRVFAENGRIFAGNRWDQRIEFFKSQSKTFCHFVENNSHGIEAVTLTITVASEIFANHHFSPPEAELIVLALLNTILQIGKKVE